MRQREILTWMAKASCLVSLGFTEIPRDRGRGKALHTRCGDRRRQSAKTQKRTFKGISGKVWPHAAFGRGRNSVGRQAAPHRNGRPWRASGNGRNLSGGETAQYRGH